MDFPKENYIVSQPLCFRFHVCFRECTSECLKLSWNEGSLFTLLAHKHPHKRKDLVDVKTPSVEDFLPSSICILSSRLCCMCMGTPEVHQALQAVQKMITEIKFKNISVKNCQVSLIHSLASLHSESTLRCSAFALVPPFKSSLPALSPWHLESLRDN